MDKFTSVKLFEWYLSMGYPPDKILPPEKFDEYYGKISRGKYGKVWRNLTENVKPESIVRHQRNNVFLDDMSVLYLNKRLEWASLSHEITLWRETKLLEGEVNQLERQVQDKRNRLKSLLQANRVRQRDSLSLKLDDCRLMKHALELKRSEFIQLKDQLSEMLNITRSYSGQPKSEPSDTRLAVARCLSSLSDGTVSQLSDKTSGRHVRQRSHYNSTLVSSARDDHSVTGESIIKADFAVEPMKLSALADHGCDTVWETIIDRQNEVVKNIAAASIPTGDRPNSKSVSVCKRLAVSSALHSTLVLKTMKNRIQANAATNKFIQLVTDREMRGSEQTSSELQLELFVVSCERAELIARRDVYRRISLQLNDSSFTRSVGFEDCQDPVGDRNAGTVLAEIMRMDELCSSKKCEMESMLSQSEVTAAKITSVCTHLGALIQSLHQQQKQASGKTENVDDVSTCSSNYDDFMSYIRGVKDDEMSVPALDDPYSAYEVRRFYDERTERADGLHAELSFNLDKSTESAHNSGVEKERFAPCYSRELRYLAEKFPLASNRKIVLESGLELWLGESLDRLKRTTEMPMVALPASTVLSNLTAVAMSVNSVLSHDLLLSLLDEAEWNLEINDTNTLLEDVRSRTDVVRHKSSELLTDLSKVERLLGQAADNMVWWCRASELHKYLSPGRLLNGMSYAQYFKSY